MDIRQQHAQITAYTTEEVYWHLANNQGYFGTQGVVLLCDQLLQRREPIKHVTQHFERMLGSLSTRKLAYFETHDYGFSKAAVHVAFRELTKRRQNTSQWFWHDGSIQQGPLNRMQIEARIDRGAIHPEHMLWKEGWPEWRRLEDLAYLTARLYFQQERVQQERMYEPPPPPPPPSGGSTAGTGPGAGQQRTTAQNAQWARPARAGNEGLVTAAAILSFITAPMWLVIAVVTPFASWGEAVGVFLPMAFALYMAAANIPYGIGLLNHRYWAWWGALVSHALGAGWMLLKVAVYHDGGLWLFVLGIEAVLVTFLASTNHRFAQDR